MVTLARPPVAPKDIGGGDDLGDDFELDDSAPLLDDDDDGDGGEGEGDEFSDAEDDTFRLFDAPEADDGIRDVGRTRALKRKAPVLEDLREEALELELELDEEEGGERGAGDDTAPLQQGKKKKKKQKKAKRARVDDAPSGAIARAGPEQLAQWFAEVLGKERLARGLSALELEEAALPEQCFEDTSAFAQDRTAEALPAFIRECLPKLATRIGQKPKNPGAPTAVVLCAAALRATELCRVLRGSGLRGEKGGEVAKLFAKHFKLSQHVDYLSKTRVAVAVATPGRLQQLLEQGALSLAALSHVLLDESHRDAKERTLASIPEVRSEIVALMRGALGARVREGNVHVVVY